MPNDNDLTGLTAVVTGASSGIGAAIAQALAGAGANCLLHYRQNRNGIDAVVASIAAATGRTMLTHACDLTDGRQHERLVDAAWSLYGKVDVWVNNAGADVLTGDAAKLSFEQKLELLMATDVMPTVRLTRLVGTRMKAQKTGAIINIGWDQAETGMAGDSGELFSTTKGAIVAFTRSAARSLAPQVRVNCVAPGWIKTAWGDRASDYWQSRAKRESLLGRWGTPEDVAAAVCFLASPAAAFITGHTLPVNGGLAHGKCD